jgi:hypothetical protein
VWSTRHERVVDATPEEALDAALAVDAASDPLTRALLTLRGLRPGRRTLEQTLGRLFAPASRSPTRFAGAMEGTPWRLGSRPGPPAPVPPPGTVRVEFELRAEPVGEGRSRLVTETRIVPADETARRAFARYWRVVGPFSGLIRQRWLGAAARAIASAKRSAAPSPNAR